MGVQDKLKGAEIFAKVAVERIIMARHEHRKSQSKQFALHEIDLAKDVLMSSWRTLDEIENTLSIK